MATGRVSREARDTRRKRRTVIIVIAVIVAALVAVIAWLGFRALQTKDELDSAVTASRQLTADAAKADFDGARTAVAALSRHSAAAASVATDPVWRAAELLPWFGANLSAVRIAAEQTHSIASDVAAPLVDLSAELFGGEKPAGAFIDVAALSEGSAALTRAETTLRHASSALSAAQEPALLPVVADGVEELATVVDQAAPLVRAAADASDVLPGMLGSDGPRTILVMLQNNAELRTGGGITGTFIALRAEDGVLTVTEQADSSDFARRKTAILPIPASTVELYGDVVGRFVQNTSITPDFPLTAQLASAWWKDYSGTAPDAVVSIDPIVLKAVLGVTGPVQTTGGPLTPENMVDKLLVEPYLMLDGKEQTTLFSKVVREVFTAVTGGDVDPIRLGDALATPIADGRMSVWSAHAEEQDVLDDTALAGPAARQRDAGPRAYAVYLNDTTGGKMDTFLDVAIAGGVGVCRSDGRGTVEITVTLKNTAPADAGRRFPVLMTGGGNFGITPGHIGTTVSVSAPPKTFVGGVTVDGEQAAQVDAEDAGFVVSAYSVDLAPGESTILTYRFDTKSASAVGPTILHTPLLTTPKITTREVDCG